MKAVSNNKLNRSPHYEKILQTYNEWLSRDGKVSNLKFHEEVVAPLIPDYCYGSWAGFVRRFKKNAPLTVLKPGVATPEIQAEIDIQENFLGANATINHTIKAALSICKYTMDEVAKNPKLLSVEKRLDLVFKVLKAQDSRINATTKVHEDVRNQQRFDHVFDSAVYGDDKEELTNKPIIING